jgi:exodeoxyribonuclease VII large subunit
VQKSFDFDRREGGPPPRDAAQPATVSVAALNRLIQELLTDRVPPLWVEGEITGWKQYRSGHCYFCLRDADAQVSAVMFASDVRRLPATPEEGMHVRAFGRAALYEKRGDFQFIVRRIDSTAEGGLWRVAFDRLRNKLAAEGLLDPERRRPLPLHPRAVGVVTSPAGAALHDILHVIRRRAPWTRVVLSPARVQGEGAARDLARALRLFAHADAPVDVVIVGRGGGSVEDLWAFNEEPVARAIAECPVPVISAVGHEIDITIADLVADRRAPTPSAAAEHAVPDGTTVLQELTAARQRLPRALRRYAQGRREHIDIARERLETRLQRLVGARRDQLTRADELLRLRMRRALDVRRSVLARLAGQVHALSPLQSLARGYAVPLDADGRILRRQADFASGKRFGLRVVEGLVDCRAESADEEQHE